MTLGDLLDELRGNILRDNSDTIAGDSDRLWSDETLLRYIKDGERRFARATLLLRDGTTAQFCQFTLVAGQRDYPLDPLVIAVVSARASTEASDLYRAGHALVQMPKPRDVLDFDVISSDVSTTGGPRCIYTDETLVYAAANRITASIYPIPDADAAGTVINMRVVRLPQGNYDENSLEVESEIPEDYQFDVLRWAAYRAKTNHDADAGDGIGADKHKAAFDEAVVKAIKETKRKMFVGTGLNYGTLGFSYTR